MKTRCMEGALACVGAVIGAGFVSGREIITFFSRYGVYSWGLILISAAAMVLLCALVMRKAMNSGSVNWCGLYRDQGRALRFCVEACVTLLLTMIGGAMVSASGHMVALLWASDWAYPIGVVGTLFLAWLIGFGNLRPLSWCGGALTILFLLSVALLVKTDAPARIIQTADAPNIARLVWAAVCAVAYAAMNLAVAVGVVCKAGHAGCRRNDRQALLFGLMLVFLLFVSNYLYLKHPELERQPFPMVALFSRFGRAGFGMSVTLLYLAVFTTLIAILYALRGAVETHVKSGTLCAAATLGAPLAVSAIGFESIVESLYAPIGLACLLVMFLPLRGRKKPAAPLAKKP